MFNAQVEGIKKRCIKQRLSNIKEITIFILQVPL
jgi:hypothetical protein